MAAVLAVERPATRTPGPKDFRDCLRAGYCCWVLEQDGRMIGHGVLSVAVGEAHVLNVCVHPDWQGRGLGRRILDRMLRLAREHEADTAFLEVRASNTVAQHLYESAASTRSPAARLLPGAQRPGGRRGLCQGADLRLWVPRPTPYNRRLAATQRQHPCPSSTPSSRAGAPSPSSRIRTPARHADGEAAAVRRRDPDGGDRQGPQGGTPRDLGLDGAREAARHLGHSSVMQFPYDDRIVNLLDTPGHEDFSETPTAPSPRSTPR